MRVKRIKTKPKRYMTKLKRAKIKKVNTDENGKGMRVMAVSMATIPVITDKGAEAMLKLMKQPMLTDEFLKECKEESDKIFVKKVNVNKLDKNKGT